ncbi:MAG: hypothetical protein CL489_03660 [Acidobacteria bacterium]|nr:hypothetical protein [Acidobacteriota bacterium]
MLELDLEVALRNMKSLRAGDTSLLKKGITEVEIQATIDKLRGQLEVSRATTDVLRDDLTVIGQLGDTVTSSLEAGMTTAFDSIIQGTMTVKQAFKQMALSVLQAISQMIAKLMAMWVVEQMLTSFAFGGSTKTTMKPNQPYTSTGSGLSRIDYIRYGGIVDAPGPKVAQTFDQGGVAKGRQAGYPAIMHGTEAVVPLPNNRSIPVELKGATGQQNVVTVNVSVANDGTARTDARQEEGQGMDLGKAIATAVQKELQFQKRSGGILNPYGVA